MHNVLHLESKVIVVHMKPSHIQTEITFTIATENFIHFLLIKENLITRLVIISH